MDPLEPPTTPPPRVPRRTARACKQCRAAKLKCSGSRPCTRCTRRRDSCTFPSDEPHVSVPERYLRELQNRLSQAQAQLQEQAAETHSSASIPAPGITSSQPVDTSFYLDSHQPSASQLSVAGAESAQQGLISQSSPVQPISQISASQSEPQRPATANPLPTPASTTSNIPVPHNPLIARDLAYVRDSTTGKPYYLGRTSTWSFYRRALSLLEGRTTAAEGSTAPLNLDGTAIRLNWEPKSQVDQSDLSNLPAVDYALYLYSTVKFHLGELFGVIDEPFFLAQFDRFHKSPFETAQANRLWFVEYLLVLAFGKAFLSTAHRKDAPSGSQLATRAMALLPDPVKLNEEPMRSVEVLALVALYLQSIDMRVSAFQYIGQALRTAYVEGIHCQVPDDVINPEFANRCNNAWWVVYVLDQEFTARMGVPPAVSEGSVTVALPSDRSSSLAAKALTLRIRLSRLTASVSNTVYGLQEGLGNAFVRSTTAVLHQLADVSRDFDELANEFNPASKGELPSMFRNISLSYHHCIVLATRPLVMWLLILTIQLTTIDSEQLLGPVATLLHTSAESATTIALVLRSLADHDLLESFLPFQLEYAFSAGLLLSILGTILPCYVPDSGWSRNIYFVLDEMIKKNNAIARLRKSELEQLDARLVPLRENHSGNIQHPPDASPIGLEGSGGELPTEFSGEVDPSQISEGDLQPDGFGQPWDAVYGIGNAFFSNPDQILELAEQLETGNLPSSFLFDYPT